MYYTTIVSEPAVDILYTFFNIVIKDYYDAFSRGIVFDFTPLLDEINFIITLVIYVDKLHVVVTWSRIVLSKL